MLLAVSQLLSQSRPPCVHLSNLGEGLESLSLACKGPGVWNPHLTINSLRAGTWLQSGLGFNPWVPERPETSGEASGGSTNASFCLRPVSLDLEAAHRARGLFQT